MNSTDPKSNVVCKVADFGLSSQMWVDSLKDSEREVANPTVWTVNNYIYIFKNSLFLLILLQWLAPEVISRTEYTVKSGIT